MEVPKEPGLEPKGGKFTPYYGAITNIWDETSSIIVKDDKENELVVEVFPIRMKEDEIYKVLQEDENRWIIKYETKLGEPSKAQIQQAIETGQLLQISQTLRVTDNYGIHYTLIYDKDKKTYVNNNKNIGLESKIEPLPDVMINYIQKDKTGTPYPFPDSARALYTIFQEQLAQTDAGTVMETLQQMSLTIDKLNQNVESLNNTVSMLEYRITKLDGGGR